MRDSFLALAESNRGGQESRRIGRQSNRSLTRGASRQEGSTTNLCECHSTMPGVRGRFITGGLAAAWTSACNFGRELSDVLQVRGVDRLGR